MEKKKRNQILLIGFVIIIVIAVILLGIFFGTGFYQKIVLYNEIERISRLDITKDQFDTEIKSTGEYAKVEEAIKEYFSEYSKSLQASLNAISEENLNKIMSDENLIEDAPNFEKTLENIQKTKEDFNTNVDALIEQMDETYIMSKIEAKNVEEEFKKLYQELMYDDEIISQLEAQKTELEESRTLLNELLDLNEQLYRLLAENPGKWKYEDNIMQIDDEELLNQYNALVEEMQSK